SALLFVCVIELAIRPDDLRALLIGELCSRAGCASLFMSCLHITDWQPIKQTCDRRRVMPHARSQSCRLFPLMRLMIFVGPCLLAGVAHAQQAVAQQNGTTDRPQLPSTARIAPAGPIAIGGPWNEFSFTNAG